MGDKFKCMDCFWTVYKRLAPESYEAAHQRNGEISPAATSQQQHEQAQQFIAEQNVLSPGNTSLEFIERIKAAAIEQSNLAATRLQGCSIQPDSSTTLGLRPLTAQPRQLSTPATASTINNANPATNEWTQDKLSRSDNTAGVATYNNLNDQNCTVSQPPVQPVSVAAVTAALYREVGCKGEPQIADVLVQLGHTIRKPSTSGSPAFSNTYHAPAGDKFMIVGDPDGMADQDDTAWEIKTRIRQQNVVHDRQAISSKEADQMLGYAMLTDATTVKLAQGLQQQGKYSESNVVVMTVLDFSADCSDYALKNYSRTRRAYWDSAVLPKVGAFVTALVKVVNNHNLQNRLVTMQKTDQALWLQNEIDKCYKRARPVK